jgi:signal transduction histidine kinase
MSDTALRNEIKRDTLSQGVFIGAAMLMLLLALINWASTRQTVYRDFSVYIASALLFILFLNGYVASYVLSESPFLVGRLSVASFAIAMASTILFSIHVLDIKKHQPKLEEPLRWIILATLVSMMFTIEFTMIDMVAKILWLTHLVIGFLLLGLSFKQAFSERSAQYWVVFSAYLSFSVFEKAPLLSMAGMLPMTAWTTDLAKIGLFFQMVLTHLQLLIRLKEQRNLQQEVMKANMEAQNEQAQRKDLIQFLGMFGHEVRTPLAIIDAATQSLEILSGVGSPQIQLRHKRIRSAVARLNLLAKEALSRERIEAGGWQLQPRPVVLRDVIEDILALYETELPVGSFVGKVSIPITIADKPGGVLVLTSLKELPDFIADPDMLQVALGNLLDNARKYADAASVIHMDIKYNQIYPSRQSSIHFNVLSQGVVLTPAELLQVFDKYWRRDEHRNIGGAGLGLYLVRLIAKAHGGSVEVRNLSNRWTCFSIQIPLRLNAVDCTHDITDESRKSYYRRR